MARTAKNCARPHRVRVKDVDSWTLICYVMHYSYDVVNLTNPQYEELYALVYSYNDAYGPRGFVPPQGYDWSGIRDSSEAAKKEMYKVILDYFEYHLKEEFIVVKDRVS